jgi:glutaredoxin
LFSYLENGNVSLMKKIFFLLSALLFLTSTLCFAMGKDPRDDSAQPASVDRVSAQKSPKNVEIFVTSWCGYCKKLEKFLKVHDIPYTRYDIEANPQAAEAYRSMGGTGVPVTRIGTDIVYGYDPDRILELL